MVGIDRFDFKGCWPEGIRPPVGESRGTRVPTNRRLENFGVGDVDDAPEVGILDTDECAECPWDRDGERWKLEIGAPLSETVSRCVESGFRSWPEGRGIRVFGEAFVFVFVNVIVVAERRAGLSGHLVLHFTLGLSARLLDVKTLPPSTSRSRKKSS